MQTLINTTKNKVIATSVEKAQGFGERSKGLLGRSSLKKGETLWIPGSYNSIHTFFMKFPLDLIFVDRNFVVRTVKTDVPPWRLVFAHWKSVSVFEMAAGQLSPDNVEKGDVLSVGH